MYQPVYPAPTATVSAPPVVPAPPTVPQVVAPPPPPPPPPITQAPGVTVRSSTPRVSGDNLDSSDIIIDSESQSGQASRGRDSSPTMDSLNGSAQLQHALVPVQTFEENVHIPVIKNSERIALAYKYVDIPDRPRVSRPVSQARGDDRSLDDDREDATKNSFPVTDYIPQAFQHFSMKYKKEVDDAFMINEAQTEGSSEGPGTLTKSLRNALKAAPEQYRWAFNCHTKGWADCVQFDRDVNTIRRDSKAPITQSIVLPQDEWRHVQWAATHGMQAGNHCDWFNTASRAALDSVLVNLNPETQSDTIECLQEVKQMLKGIAYANEHMLDNFVYIHAGITATLREGLIKAEGNYIPQDMRPFLQYQPFGGNMVFNGKCSVASARIKEDNQDAAWSTLAKGSAPGPGGRPSSSLARIPKKAPKKAASPSQPPPQFKSPLATHPATSHSPTPAGRGQGSFRGGKPGAHRGRNTGGPKNKSN